MTSLPLGASTASCRWAWPAMFLAVLPIAWLIVLSEPQLMLAIGTAAALLAAALRWPIVAGIAVVASVPVQQVGAVGPLTVTRALVVFAVAATVVVVLAQRRPLMSTWIALPFTALIAWMTVSAASAKDPALAVDEILRWVVALVAFLVMLQLFVGTSERALVIVVSAIGAVAALQAMTGIMQSLLALGPASFEVAGRFSRAYGTFGRPNTFAGYLEMALFPVMWLGLHTSRSMWESLRRYRLDRHHGFVASRKSRRMLIEQAVFSLLLLGSAGVIAVAIVISFSRGAWLGVSFGLILSVAIAIRKHWIAVLAAIPAVVLLVVVGVTSVAPAAVSDRIASIAAESRPFDASSATITDNNFAAVERMAHWQAGWDMFIDHPLAGVGPGNYNAEYSEYFVRTEFRHSQGHAHNFYIHLLAETGLVGLLVYLVLVVSVFGLALWLAVKSSGLERALALGGVGTIAAVGAHDFFENLHVLNLGIQLGATWVLVIAAHRQYRARHFHETVGLGNQA